MNGVYVYFPKVTDVCGYWSEYSLLQSGWKKGDIMQMKTISHKKAAHLFLLLAFHVLVLSMVANAEVIEWFPDGTPQVVKNVTASGPYRYEEHISYTRTGEIYDRIKKTYKNDRLRFQAGPGWEKRYDDYGHLIYEKNSAHEKKCKSNGNCEVIQKQNGFTTYFSCMGSTANCLITKVSAFGC